LLSIGNLSLYILMVLLMRLLQKSDSISFKTGRISKRTELMAVSCHRIREKLVRQQKFSRNCSYEDRLPLTLHPYQVDVMRFSPATAL